MSWDDCEESNSRKIDGYKHQDKGEQASMKIEANHLMGVGVKNPHDSSP